MSHIQTRLPGISKAVILMERCNGGVNRYRTEGDVLKALARAIETDGLDIAMNLPAIDAYFTALPDDELLTVVDGEETERDELMKAAPDGADAFLQAIFDRAD